MDNLKTINNKIIRCQAKCVTTNKICKHRTTNIFNIKNKYYCYQHANIYSIYYITYIQKIYRAYKNRNLIKNIYINLPDDIQKKIIFYIRQDHHYKKYKDKLFHILYKKINYYNDNLTYSNIYFNSSYLAHIYKNSKDFENLFYYYDKYLPIMLRINHGFIIIIKNKFDKFKYAKENYYIEMIHNNIHQDSAEFIEVINNLYFIIEKYYNNIKKQLYTYNITYDGYGRII